MKSTNDTNDFQAIIKQISENDPKTTTVRINYPIGDKGAKDLAEALKKNTFVTKLNLSNSEIGYKGALYFAELLSANRSLVALNLSNNKIGSAGAIQLGLALQHNATLEDLDLSKNQINSDGAIFLAKGLKNNNHIKDLNLADNEIGNSGVNSLGLALKTNTALKFLDLNNNQIEDDGAKSLAETLQFNKIIEYLDLKNNQIGNEGANSLAETLKSDEKIKYLNLKNNQIGNEGTKSLAESLRVNKKIEHLVLENNPIGVEGAQALADALSKFNITLYHLGLTSSSSAVALINDDIEKITNINQGIPIDIAKKLYPSLKQEQVKEGQDHSAPPESMLEPVEKRLIAISPDACIVILEELLEMDGISKKDPEAIINQIKKFGSGEVEERLPSNPKEMSIDGLIEIYKHLRGENKTPNPPRPTNHSQLSKDPPSNSRD